MNGKFKSNLLSLGKAVQKLEAVLKRPADEYMRDSAIQRFEFTYELVWKTLKACLEEEGVRADSPRDALREAFSQGLITDDPLWLETIKLRNLTSHTYNEAAADEIYAALPRVLPLYQKLQKTLENLK